MTAAMNPAGGDLMKIPYRYVTSDRDRHGTLRVYFRFARRKVRMRDAPGSPGFAGHYEQLLADCAAPQWQQPPPSVGPQPGTLAWLAQRYQTSSDFAALEPSTRATRRRLTAAMLDEPVHPGAGETFDAFPLPRLTLAALEVLRDRKRTRPGAANDRVKALRALFKWAAVAKLLTPNPALGLVKIRPAPGEGHHTWTVAEVAQFERRHPRGTKAHLAMTLMLYTGARRSDATRLGRQHERAGVLRWTAYKNRNRFPATIEIPVLPPLAAALAAGPTGELVFLVTEFGKPFSIPGFGNWFKDRCVEAGLAQCSAHGLRKAGSARAAEAGATAHQLMAIYGWRSLSEAERYTRAAEGCQ